MTYQRVRPDVDNFRFKPGAVLLSQMIECAQKEFSGISLAEIEVYCVDGGKTPEEERLARTIGIRRDHMPRATPFKDRMGFAFPNNAVQLLKLIDYALVCFPGNAFEAIWVNQNCRIITMDVKVPGESNDTE